MPAVQFREGRIVSNSHHLTVTMIQKLFAHLETMRPYTLLWCGLVSLLAPVSYGDLPPFKISLLVFFIPIMGWIAGLYLADYYDRTLDAIQKPYRHSSEGFPLAKRW